MRHLPLHCTIYTPSHTPAHTQLLEHTPPYNMTNQDIISCETPKLLALHRTSLANYDTGIGFRWTYRTGSIVICILPVHCVVIDNISPAKVILEPCLLHFSIDLISVTKLWDMIFRLCMSKDRMYHTNIKDSKPSWLTLNPHDIVMPLTLKSECAMYIEDKIY